MADRKMFAEKMENKTIYNVYKSYILYITHYFKLCTI